MSLSKRAVLTTGAALLLGLSTVAMAQTGKKSAQVATMGDGDAVMIGPKGQRLHKSNVKITAAQHEAALKKGAKEIKPGAVIYKQGGKLYMIEDSGNEKASQGFQGNFDVDY